MLWCCLMSTTFPSGSMCQFRGSSSSVSSSSLSYSDEGVHTPVTKCSAIQYVPIVFLFVSQVKSNDQYQDSDIDNENGFRSSSILYICSSKSAEPPATCLELYRVVYSTSALNFIMRQDADPDNAPHTSNSNSQAKKQCVPFGFLHHSWTAHFQT